MVAFEVHTKKEIDDEVEERKKVIRGHAEKCRKDFDETHKEVREGFEKHKEHHGKHGGWNKEHHEW
jgi:uncharacterized coiled-coil DUF342 family protein